MITNMLTTISRSLDLKIFVNNACMSFGQRSCFSTTVVCFQLPDHPLFASVDWSRVQSGDCAVVDPMDSNNILYLSEREYKIQVRVSMRQDHKLAVLAVPYSKPLDSESSPHYTGGMRHEDRMKWARLGHTAWVNTFTAFLKERFASWVVYNSEEDLLITLTDRNIREVLGEWFTRTLFWAHGLAVSTPKIEHYKVLSQRHVSRMREFDGLLLGLVKVLRTQGPKGLVLRMKALLYVMNAWVGDSPLNGSRHTGIPIKLSRGGLPACLPSNLRRYLWTQRKEGRYSIFRTYVSLLNAYKVIHCPGVISLGSITRKGPSGEAFNGLLSDISLFFKRRVLPKLQLAGADPGVKVLKTSESFLTSAGPNNPIAGCGRWLDARAWTLWSVEKVRWGPLDETGVSHRLIPEEERQKPIAAFPLRWAQAIQDKDLFEYFRSSFELADWDKELQAVVPYQPEKQRELFLGKLSLKEEASGKMRIFAIADYWTQRIGTPIHKWLEDCLRLFPTDCTFDQNAGLRRFAEKKLPYVASYDLSSATDRIPLALYKSIFKHTATLGSVTELWAELMVDRWWRIPKSILEHPAFIPGAFKDHPFVRYTVGQPMGARSSWPAMAFIHHCLVLYSAWKAGVDDLAFEDYAILGDDVVIGNKAVAREYAIACSCLGIGINLKKSYTSEKSMLNFANQTYVGLVNVSPISLKEELRVDGILPRLSFATRVADRFTVPGELSVSGVMKLLTTPSSWNGLIKVSNNLTRVLSRSRIALLLWFYPDPERFRIMGIRNLSMIPLLWVLALDRRLWDAMPKIRSLRLPWGTPSGAIIYLYHLILRDLEEQARRLAVVTGLRATSVNKWCRDIELCSMEAENYFTEKGEIAFFENQMAWANLGHLACSLESDANPGRLCLSDGREIEYFDKESQTLNEENLLAAISDCLDRQVPLPNFESQKGEEALRSFEAVRKRGGETSALRLYTAICHALGRTGILCLALGFDPLVYDKEKINKVDTATRSEEESSDTQVGSQPWSLRDYLLSGVTWGYSTEAPAEPKKEEVKDEGKATHPNVQTPDVICL